MVGQIYISGALTNSSRKDFYESIGNMVKKAGYTPYIPHLHTDPEKNPNATPEEVYDIDMDAINNSRMVIAYVGYPSLGVGAELERASENFIPIILLYQKGEKVSRLAKGFPLIKGIYEYDTEKDALEWIYKYLLKSPLDR